MWLYGNLASYSTGNKTIRVFHKPKHDVAWLNEQTVKNIGNGEVCEQEIGRSLKGTLSRDDENDQEVCRSGERQ